MRMQFYTAAELVQILKRQADNDAVTEDGAEEVAKRSRGAWVAGRLLHGYVILPLLTGQSWLLQPLQIKRSAS